MPVFLNQKDLKTLNLEIEEVKKLSEEKQVKTIRKAWKKLAIVHHTDKGGDVEKFRAVTDAYRALTGANSQEGQVKAEYDFDIFLPEREIDIPEDAFDLLMREGINDTFVALRKQLIVCESEEEKRRFVTQYASFFILAKELERRAEQLMRVCVEALYQQSQETLGKYLQREWRVLVIRLFGEEYLDDFQYRAALATGNLRPILALRKLASPIKWVAFIVASLELLLRGTGDYCVRHQLGYFAVAIYFIGSPISVVHAFVEKMAMPVNLLIKPLARYTKIPPAVYTGLLLCIGVGISYGLMAGLLMPLLPMLAVALPFITLAINLYSLFVTYQIVKSLQANGVSAKTVGCSFGLMILLNMIPSGVPVVDFLFVIGSLCLLYAVKKLIADKPIEYLPLPKEPVSEELKSATHLGYRQANQSHRFFGTPKDAEFDNHRTFWKKTGSFFGFDYINHQKPEAKFDRPLSLTYDSSTALSIEC